MNIFVIDLEISNFINKTSACRVKQLMSVYFRLELAERKGKLDGNLLQFLRRERVMQLLPSQEIDTHLPKKV